MADMKRWNSVRETASELNLSAACLRKWIAERRIAHTRLGRAIRISRDEIERIVAAGTIPARDSRR